MESGHTYYNKEISWSRQLFQEANIARERVYLKTIDRKLTLNLIVIFNSFTDISFLKYVAKIFCLLLFLRNNFGVFWGAALGGCVCVYFIK